MDEFIEFLNNRIINSLNCGLIILMVNLTAIVTAHNEGHFLLSALSSVRRNFSQVGKIDYEILISLDRADHLTTKIAKTFAANNANCQIITHDFGDVGKARQSSLSKSSFDYVAFLDGDDVFGDFWLKSVTREARKNKDIIWHPDLTIYFDSEIRSVRKNVDGTKKKFRKDFLIFENFWTSTFVTPKHIMESVPMKGGNTYDQGNPYAYEDWSWFRDTVSLGYKHGVIKKTVNFVRLKVNSNTTRTLSLGKRPWPTNISNLLA